MATNTKVTMDTDFMTYVLDGGIQQTRRRRYIEHIGQIWLTRSGISRQTISGSCSGSDNYVITGRCCRAHHVTQLSEKFGIFRQLVQDAGLRMPKDIYNLQRTILRNEMGSVENMLYNYLGDFSMRGSEKQFRQWEDKIRRYYYLPNFAQTELGHGSHVRGLETVAVYDMVTKEFVINTPSVTSVKWWSATVDGISSHFQVVARVAVEGGRTATEQILVPFRDDQGRPYPGVTLGDIGPCLGCNGLLYRYYSLQDVRVPADAILSRGFKLTEEGLIRYDPGDIQLGTHTVARCQLTFYAARALAEVTSTCVTYCGVISNCKDSHLTRDPDLVEFGPVLQSQQIQMILFPRLCEAYAFWITHQHVDVVQAEIIQEVRAGHMARNKPLHGLSAGLKAYTTFTAARGIRECMTHFYHPDMTPDLFDVYTNLATVVTADGDVTVMMMQTARYIVNHVLRSKHSIDPLFAFLVEPDHETPIELPPVVETSHHTVIDSVTIRAYMSDMLHYMHVVHEMRARRVYQKVKEQLSHEPDSTSLHDVLYANQVLVHDMAKIYVEAHIARTFIIRVICLPESSPQDISARYIFQLICLVYTTELLLNNKAHFLQFGIVRSSDIEVLHGHLDRLLIMFYPHCQVAADAFDMSLPRELKTRLKSSNSYSFQNNPSAKL